MASTVKKFIATYDLHFGFQRRNGHKVPIHDIKAWNAAMAFAKDFRPDTWIHGGDLLDLGVVSHWNKTKPGQIEGLRLIADAEEGRKLFIEPVEELVKGDKIYITGNHERFLTDLTDEMPSLEGIIDLNHLLKLNKWKVIPQGGGYSLGKLYFIHGDQIRGGEHSAKQAVLNFERNIRFGHFHTYAVYTKTSPIDTKLGKTGIALPCLCTKDVNYGQGKPNRWMQGFSYGYVYEGGAFNDYVVTIIDGKCVVNGKLYKG